MSDRHAGRAGSYGRLAIGALFAVSVAACGGSSTTGATSTQTLTVGQFDTVTGAGASLGQPLANGEKLAVDHVNKAGGLTVGGVKYQIKLVQYDDMGTPAGGITAMTRAVEQDHQKFMTGLVTSAVVSALLPFIKSHAGDFTMVSDSAVLPALTQGNPNIFRSYPAVSEFDRNIVTYVAANHLSPIAVVTDQTNTGWAADASNFDSLISKNNIEVVDRETMKRGDTNFTALVTKVKAAKLKAVVLRMYPDEELLFIKQSADQNYHPAFMSVNAAGPLGLQRLSADQIEGLAEINVPILADLVERNTPFAKQVADEYQAEFGAPPQNLALMGWAAMRILLAGIQKAGTVSDQAKVRTALSSLAAFPELVAPYVAQNGHIFGPDHEISLIFSVRVWKNGQAVLQTT